MTKDIIDSTEEYEKAIEARGEEKYILRLYVSGMTSKSIRAIETIKKSAKKTSKDVMSLKLSILARIQKSLSQKT